MDNITFNQTMEIDGPAQAMPLTSYRKRVTRGSDGNKRARGVLVISLATVLSLLTVFTTAQAQSASGPAVDDPVEHAIKQTADSVDARADAAEKVIAAARLVQQAKSAADQGEREGALQSLKQASSLLDAPVSAGSVLARSYLLSISEQAALLEPARRTLPVAISLPEPSSSMFSRTSLTRLGQYGEGLASILKQEGLPPGLLAVAVVESGLNRFALSPKGARGIWQFMPATARRYGLSVLADVDDRIRPEESTRAAARYLRDLYNRFGDWPLALAAYNAGEERVQRAIDKSNTASFEELAERHLLPQETRAYVPAVMKAWASLRQLYNPDLSAPARPDLIPISSPANSENGEQQK